MVILYFFVEIFLKINKKRNNHIKREKRSTDKNVFFSCYFLFLISQEKKETCFFVCSVIDLFKKN